MKILLDTNIILDALMLRKPWAESAQSLLLNITEEKIIGCITANTITDLYYLINKHLKNSDETKKVLLRLFSYIKILDVNSADCKKAFTLNISDYEDSLLICCAVRHKIDFIVTHNLKDFKNSPIKSISADDMNAIIAD